MKKPLTIKEIFDKNDMVDRIMVSKKNITEEFQDFGYRVALKLNDLPHTALYIKLAKELPRGLFDEILGFSLDYPITSGKRAKIFMWRLNKICAEKGIKIPGGRQGGHKAKNPKPKFKPQMKMDL